MGRAKGKEGVANEDIEITRTKKEKRKTKARSRMTDNERGLFAMRNVVFAAMGAIGNSDRCIAKRFLTLDWRGAHIGAGGPAGRNEVHRKLDANWRFRCWRVR
jgi:hypothetical protein